MTTVAISLKMYFGPARAQAYCAALASLAARHPEVVSGATALVVLPSFLAIPAALSAARTTSQVGAQDLDRGRRRLHRRIVRRLAERV